VHNDSMFRAVFARPQNLRRWLQDLLRDQPIAQQIDWDTLEPMPQITANAQLAQKLRDLVFLARQRGTSNLVLIVIEMVTGNRRGIGKRTVTYTIDSMYDWNDSHPTGPHMVALPIVLHLGPHKLSHNLWIDAPKTPFRLGRDNAGIGIGIALDELAGQSEAEIRARDLPPPVTLAMLFAQFVNRRQPDEVEALLLSWKELFQQLVHPPGAMDDVQIFQSYVLKTTTMSVDHCTRVFEQILDEDGAVSMETTAKKLMAQARQEGREEGREEGRALGEARGEARGAAAGRRQLLEQLLRRRFGKLSKRFVARLNAATDSQLDAIGLRLLDAASIEDAFAI
jgi:Domain of unknown function (DUF4351)/Putative transposase, YhgA-like